MTEVVKPAPSLCDGCDQTDDHPKIHVWGQWVKNDRMTVTDPSFHGDCLPEEYVSLLGDAPQHATTKAMVEQARKGVHGDKLRKHIQSLPDDNEVGANTEGERSDAQEG